MDIKAFKRYCLKSFGKDYDDYVKKLKGELPITIFDYLFSKDRGTDIFTCKEKYNRCSKNKQTNEDTLDEIIKTDLFLGVNQSESVDEAKIIGLLESLGYEMGDDYAMHR